MYVISKRLWIGLCAWEVFVISSSTGLDSFINEHYLLNKWQTLERRIVKLAVAEIIPGPRGLDKDPL